jgi:Sec7-like guanine-nucleotide exchange factor
MAWSKAIDSFAKTPHEAIQFLIQEKKISNDQDTVDFLNTSNIEKRSVSRLLIMPEYESVSLLFMKRVNFANKSVATALRDFLKAIVLPNSSQTLKAIMRQFAKGYCAQNATSLGSWIKSDDDVYLLGYSILTLNAAVHNPKIDKMTKSQFCGSIKTMIPNIPDQEAETVYKDVESQPIIDARNPSVSAEQGSSNSMWDYLSSFKSKISGFFG